MNFIKDNEHEVELKKLLLIADKVILCSGWLFNDGMRLIEDALKTAISKNVPIVMYSSIQHTQKKEIKKFKKFSNFIHKTLSQETGKIHTKLYYFEHGNSFTAIVGSANITKGGLIMNKELSIKIKDLIGSENHSEILNYIKSLEELS